MGRLLFYLFATFVMALVFMVVSSDFIYKKGNKASKKENREAFEKDIEDLAKKIKNEQ